MVIVGTKTNQEEISKWEGKSGLTVKRVIEIRIELEASITGDYFIRIVGDLVHKASKERLHP